MPETISGTGEDELAAMIDLRVRLDERRRDEKLAEIDRRSRAVALRFPSANDDQCPLQHCRGRGTLT